MPIKELFEDRRTAIRTAPSGYKTLLVRVFASFVEFFATAVPVFWAILVGVAVGLIDLLKALTTWQGLDQRQWLLIIIIGSAVSTAVAFHKVRLQRDALIANKLKLDVSLSPVRSHDFLDLELTNHGAYADFEVDVVDVRSDYMERRSDLIMSSWTIPWKVLGLGHYHLTTGQKRILTLVQLRSDALKKIFEGHANEHPWWFPVGDNGAMGYTDNYEFKTISELVQSPFFVTCRVHRLNPDTSQDFVFAVGVDYSGEFFMPMGKLVEPLVSDNVGGIEPKVTRRERFARYILRYTPAGVEAVDSGISNPIS